MYFKKLELIGFKSFCEKTILEFEPGITAIVGPNGCGKCLHYDSLVTLSTGAQVKIGDLVEASLQNASSREALDDGFLTYDNPNNISILSLNPQTHSIESRLVSAFIKRRSPAYLLKIVTKSGRTVITTHYHPFFTIKDGQIVSLKAEELRVGIRIAAPRFIPSSQPSTSLDLMSILQSISKEDNLYVPYSAELEDFILSINQQQPPSLKTAVQSLCCGQAINVVNFVNILKNKGINEIPDFVTELKSRSSGHIKLPREINASVARFLGYIISEGRTNSSNQVWFVNEEMPVVDDFVACTDEAFGVKAKVFNYKGNTRDVIIFSSALGEFLEKAFGIKIDGVSKEKIVPPQIFEAPQPIIGEFLSALFEGDGYLHAQGGDYIEYATASKELAAGVSSLLLRLGVLSVIREKFKSATNTKAKEKRTYYSVYIYGLDNIKQLAKFLRFKGRKAERLKLMLSHDYACNPNLDLIPGINGLFKDLIKRAGINVKRVRKLSPKLAAYYEDRCLPSRQGLKEALAVVAEHGVLSGFAKVTYDYLASLADSAVYWDEVTLINKVQPDEWVYDLSVANTHNFMAQDIIVHNSNIFDSIRWVLGEQSAKSLRGSEMQDVIFNGTDLKEPFGMAEVTLTFDNKNNFFNIDHDELVVTRRLFRSGESEYLINKTQVRLKDILDILLGTGIGAESYSIVAQGKIDLVLSSRPEDRRLVFDEASGITKYKAQKRETMRKLEETEQNLLRVNDIVTEVKRQISSLERQANKARRYKEVFEELKAKEINLAVAQKEELLCQKNEIEAKIKGLMSEESGLLEIINGKESKISDSQNQLKELENARVSLRDRILNSENLMSRNNGQIGFNKERIAELDESKRGLQIQIEQAKNRIKLDEEKLNNIKDEYERIKKDIELKTVILGEKETQITKLAASIKDSLEKIAASKKNIIESVARIAGVKNEISEFGAQQQIFLARKKRLEIERLKVCEEKSSTQAGLDAITLEVQGLKKGIEEFNLKAQSLKEALEKEKLSLDETNAKIGALEKDKLALLSHMEFLKELKSKYDGIGESMNAVIQLDRLPKEKISGLVVKIRDIDTAGLKMSGEAKPVELDTLKIEAQINKLDEELQVLKDGSLVKQEDMQKINNSLTHTHQEIRGRELTLANKESSLSTILEQFNKIKEEEEIIHLELQDVSRELSVLEKNLDDRKALLSHLEIEHRKLETTISEEERNISENSKIREELLVAIASIKTELNALNNRISSDKATLKILEDTYRQDCGQLDNMKSQISAAENKKETLSAEIEECRNKITGLNKEIEDAGALLKDAEEKHTAILSSTSGASREIELFRAQCGEIKNKLHESQMSGKDLDYRYSSIKERILQGYKIDLEAVQAPAEAVDIASVTREIAALKQKLDSYGTVNLVAIEEYDELKKRYDFLVQQQNDLLTAKESLHQAILKINRTTKQMFIETFEKVREEFRNYFRLLFNGGDAQVFLIDEQDPLESGIEIICRPPGKKLQNVLLLSGGEKSLSAIALIFAIFKVKPSPFCVLDEIDAALDEANVDRFGRVLQDFAKASQFIVITHNKRTIANAGVMYGITMQQSGVSKIVSVKFAKNVNKDAEPEAVAA
jgi:chromosome segregation protein